VVDGYWHYPKNLVQSVHGVPGKGGTVSALLITYSPPPTPLGNNSYWQQLNRRLGVNLQPIIVPEADWSAKLATVMAGGSGNLPDFMLLTGSVPHELAFLQSQCEDLTPYLADDAIKEYPNLANIPSHAWRATFFNGRIYGLPQDRGVFGDALFILQNLADEVGISQPQSIDDFTRLMKDLTRPRSNQWGMGAAEATNYNLSFFQQVFGAPNGWTVDGGGKFTADIETEGTKEAVSYLRSLFKMGIFHPDSNSASTIQSNDDFYGGRFAAFENGFSAYQTFWEEIAQINPKSQARVVIPFGQNGGHGRYFFGTGSFGVTAIKKSSPERVRELLRVANYLAAPFGTKEAFFIDNGVQNTDYTLDSQGDPTVTQRGQAEMPLNVGYASRGYIASAPWVYVDTQYSDFIRTIHSQEQQLVPLGVENPTVGLYSETNSDQGADLATLIQDQVTGVIAGRLPMSAYETMVQNWRSQGGDQMRTEYQHAYEQSKKTT
jgi:putative aldouronate transport system substrate-binding protein